MVRVLLLGALNLLVVTNSGCGKPVASSESPPIAPGASGVRRIQLDATSHQISFTAPERGRSRAIRDFYAQWAEENGWRKLPESEEGLSVDRWISFDTPEGRRHQFSVVWRSEDERRNLYLVQAQMEDLGEIEVSVLLRPAMIVIDPSERAITLEEAIRRGEGPPKR
jgi:hypothetical protein